MYYIGVDLGGTSIAFGIVKEDGEIIHQDRIPTRFKDGYQAVIDDIADTCKKMLMHENIQEDEIISIGIGAPGTIDSAKGIVLYANNLEFENVNFREGLNKYFKQPIYIDNDANCAAFGESISGAAKNYNNSITVTLGTGFGSGIIIDKKIYKGTFGGAGEIGHHVMVVDGIPCNCGRNGCVESYCTANALIRDTKEAVSKNKDSLILEMANNDFDSINAKNVFDAYNLKDAVAIELVKNYVKYLGEALANTINIFQPDIIVMGGGVSEAGDSLLIPLREQVSKKTYGGASNYKTKIEGASLGNKAGIVGAAFLKE